MLKFDEAYLNKIGGKTALEGTQWGNITIILQDTETDHRRAIDLNVLLPKRADATMRELEEAARIEAIAILEAALDLLRGSSLGELTAREES